MRISVIMATYNGAKYIESQLNSLKDQTHKPFEMVISDDGSTDETRDIVARFAHTTDIPVRVFKNPESLGFADNFMAGASQCQGDMIAFCDQDDIWNPGKLAAVAAAFQAPEVVMCTHQASLIDGNGQDIGFFDQGITANTVKLPLSHDAWGAYYGFSIAFRRTLMDVIPSSARGIDYISGHARLSHDRWITYLANILGATCEIAEPLVAYRQHQTNLYGAKRRPFDILNKAKVRQASAYYVQAAHEQRALLNQIPTTAEGDFPLFDRQKVVAFYDAALMEQQQRAQLYTSPNALSLLKALVTNLLNGVYTHRLTSKLNLRAVGRDALYLFAR